MLVKDFMQKNPVYVKETATIKDIVRLIFNLHISAVLVVSTNKKLAGIITEEDILHRLFPSVRDFMEGYVNDEIGSYVDERLHNLMNQSVTSIMTKKIMSVNPDTSLMSAQSKMLINDFSHLPILDKNQKIVGIISQGDIFKAIVGEEVPYESEGQYHDWFAGVYDLMFGGIDRYKGEAKGLEDLFKKKGIVRVADIGCGTGGHAVELARHGTEVDGFDLSKRMLSSFKSKTRKVPPPVARRLKTIHTTDYTEALDAVHEPYDAIMFLGNALAHIGKGYKKILKSASKKLTEKGTIIIMISNFEHTLKDKGRLQYWNVASSPTAKNKEYAFAMFLDPPKSQDNMLTITTSIMATNNNRWNSASINSFKIYNLKKDEVIETLQKQGFVNFSLFGSQIGESIFAHPYDPETAYWITIVASR